MKQPIVCDKCGYEWETGSTHIYVSCPSCLSKVKVKQEGTRYVK